MFTRFGLPLPRIRTASLQRLDDVHFMRGMHASEDSDMVQLTEQLDSVHAFELGAIHRASAVSPSRACHG